MPYEKDPDARLDYGRDWSAWLTDGETITASTWTPHPDNPDASLAVESSSIAGTLTTVWVAGGTVGARYGLINHITTSAGRQDDRTSEWVIRER